MAMESMVHKNPAQNVRPTQAVRIHHSFSLGTIWTYLRPAFFGILTSMSRMWVRSSKPKIQVLTKANSSIRIVSILSFFHCHIICHSLEPPGTRWPALGIIKKAVFFRSTEGTPPIPSLPKPDLFFLDAWDFRSLTDHSLWTLFVENEDSLNLPKQAIFFVGGKWI